jgi:hypothetical protein
VSTEPTPSAGTGTLAEQYRVLVAEKIAESGVELLRERFDVDVGLDLSPEELLARIRRRSTRWR